MVFILNFVILLTRGYELLRRITIFCVIRLGKNRPVYNTDFHFFH